MKSLKNGFSIYEFHDLFQEVSLFFMLRSMLRECVPQFKVKKRSLGCEGTDLRQNLGGKSGFSRPY